MKPAGFRGLTEVLNLSDEQIRTLVLGNWHKLNKVLMSEPGIASVRRLMVVELGGAARGDILVRLRSALSKANGVEAKAAMARILADLKRGEPHLSMFDMAMLGLLGIDCQKVNALRTAAKAKPVVKKKRSKR